MLYVSYESLSQTVDNNNDNKPFRNAAADSSTSKFADTLSKRCALSRGGWQMTSNSIVLTRSLTCTYDAFIGIFSLHNNINLCHKLFQINVITSYIQRRYKIILLSINSEVINFEIFLLNCCTIMYNMILIGIHK